MKRPGFWIRDWAFAGPRGLRSGVLVVSLGLTTAASAAVPAATVPAATPAPAAATAPDITTATVRALPPLPPTPAATRPPTHSTPDLPDSAPPGMRRCVRADGSTVFTDRRCELMEATPDGLPAGEPPAPQAAAPTASTLVRVRTCARTQGDLLEGVRMALEARDPNRFAEFYHWTEMGNAEGYQLVERLARFAERPLVDVQLSSSQDRAALDSPMASARAPGPSWFPRDPSAAPAPATPPSQAVQPPPAPPRRSFDLLRVDQLRGDDAIDTQTTWFHLRSNAGCWWLQF